MPPQHYKKVRKSNEDDLSHYNNQISIQTKKIKHMKNLKSIALALVVVFATATASAQTKSRRNCKYNQLVGKK
jgi:lipid II:glycine glycyltransferase (peptidoglycan interpeptide bridge formation enzyme)